MSLRWAAVATLLSAVAVWTLGLEVDAGRDGVAAMGSLLRGFVAPNLSGSMLARVGELAVQTASVAVVGTALGGLLAVALATFVATTAVPGHRGVLRRAVASGIRLGFDGLRAIPDFAWALALLVVLGPGAWTGAIAIAVSVTGILGRAFTHLLESVQARDVRGVERAARAPIAALAYGRWPRVSAAAWSYALARLECSVRNASVIGVVGGGGLGAELFEELGYGRMDRVATLLLGLLVVTGLADVGSAGLRKRWSRGGAWGLAAAAVVASLAWLLPDAVALVETLSRLDPRVAARSMLRLSQPELSVAALREAARGVGVPLSLAWLSMLGAGTVAGVLLPWTSTAVRRRARGPAARRGTGALALVVRGMALVARAVPEVAWLLLLAAAFGMGTLPALIALIVHATGVLVRLFTEAVDDRFVPALGRALAGGAAVGWLVYVALPRVRGSLSMHTALQAESNLRAAFTLGILGAGGLGESFHTAISFWELERASTLALAMFGLFVVVDRLARRLAKF